MSDNVPVTEVFADVDPDPDAVIESFGADSLAELLDGPGDHDPTTDDELDDVEAAATLLGELADATLERAETDPEGQPTEAGKRPTEIAGVTIGPDDSTPSNGTDDRDGPTDAILSDARVDVLPGDGKTIGEFLGLDEPLERRTRERDGLVLVGPEPTANRVSNETFGAGADAVSGLGPTTQRSEESELASSVFNWAS